MASYAWFFYSLSAAVLWGLGYVLSEKVLKAGITPLFYLFVVSVLGTIGYGVFLFFEGWKTSLEVLEKRNTINLIITSAIFVVANICIAYSVLHKNATMASFIEITYPVFTALFAWVILKEVQFNTISVVGALLIFSGIGLIFFGSD